MTKSKHTDEEFFQAVKTSRSIREVFDKLGLAQTGGSYKTFHGRIKKFNIDISHFSGQGHLKGKTHEWNTKIPLEEILVENSTYACSSRLNKRLIREGILSNKCDQCGISTWQNTKLSLHLDHIDGNNTNNQIGNLRLLCPNCHSLTSTYCGRNKKSKMGITKYYCEICNKELLYKRKTNRCIKCREI